MFGVYDGADAPLFLGFGYDMDCECSLTRGFGAVDFGDASAGKSPHAKGEVKPYGAGGDGFYVLYGFVAEAHEGAFAEVFFYIPLHHFQGFELGFLVGYLDGGSRC